MRISAGVQIPLHQSVRIGRAVRQLPAKEYNREVALVRFQHPQPNLKPE